MNYTRIKPEELVVGKPVEHPLFDNDRRLLLARGVVVESEKQRQELLTRGLFRKIPAPTRLRTGPAPEDEADDKGVDICQLEDIRLSVGENLQLQSQIQGQTDRHAVKLIGYLKGGSVMVTTPKQNGYTMLLREGQAFVVRFFSGKSAYAFTTTVLKSLNTPYPHLHLTYPSEVRGLLVRSGKRANVNLIASVSQVGGETRGATLHDLSLGGAMLSSKLKLGKVDERIQIKAKVSVSELDQFLSLTAVVRNVRAETLPEDGAVRYQHGVQFVDVEPPTQLALSAFVFQSLLDSSLGL